MGPARAALDALPRAPLPRRRRAAAHASATRASSRSSRSSCAGGSGRTRRSRTRRRRYLPGGRRPARRRHRVVPARRPAAEVRPRLDGRLARAALAVPRPPRRRARALRCRASSRRARSRSSRRSPPTCRPRSPRAARPASACRSTAGSARSCGRSRTTCCSAATDRGLFRRAELERLLARARRRPRRPRPPALVPVHARALAAHVRRRRRGRRSPPREPPTRLRARRRGAARCRASACSLHERGGISRRTWRRSDASRACFVDTGTFGFIPGEPSANTQPLYAWFLIPIYWVAGRHWWSVGARADRSSRSRRRSSSTRSAAASLSPRLGLDRGGDRDPPAVPRLARRPRATARSSTSCSARRCSARARRRRPPDALAGRRARCSSRGLAILSNTRLLAAAARARRVPALAAGSAGSRPSLVPVLAGRRRSRRGWCATRSQVGCFAITTDARALWKANNLEHLRHARRRRAGSTTCPSSPSAAVTGRDAGRRPARASAGTEVQHVDECAQQRLLRAPRAWQFWEHHPGAKVKLMAQATRLLWSPSVIERRRAGPTRRRVDHAAHARRAALHDPALPARHRRPLLRARRRSACSR